METFIIFSPVAASICTFVDWFVIAVRLGVGVGDGVRVGTRVGSWRFILFEVEAGLGIQTAQKISNGRKIARIALSQTQI